MLFAGCCPQPTTTLLHGENPPLWSRLWGKFKLNSFQQAALLYTCQGKTWECPHIVTFLTPHCVSLKQNWWFQHLIIHFYVSPAQTYTICLMFKSDTCWELYRQLKVINQCQFLELMVGQNFLTELTILWHEDHCKWSWCLKKAKNGRRIITIQNPTNRKALSVCWSRSTLGFRNFVSIFKIFTIITICCLLFKTCKFSFNSLDKYGITDVGFIFENGLNSNLS